MNVLATDDGSEASPRTWRRVFGALAAFLIVVLVVLVASSPHRFVFDEDAYQENVPRLLELGASRRFLIEMSCPAGPLYPFVHVAAYPLTGGEPPAIRFVTVAALLLALLGFGWVCRRRGAAVPTACAAMLLAVPQVWKTSGIALTEIPAVAAMLCSLGLLLSVVYRDPDRQSGGALLTLGAVGSGLLMSAAILGRQPLVVAHLTSLLLLLDRRVGRTRLLVHFTTALALPAYVFSVWGGLLPRVRVDSSFKEGLSLEKPLLCAGYAAVAMLIVAPRWFRVRVTVGAGVVLAAVAFNCVTGMRPWMPLETTLNSVLPESLLRPVQLVSGGLFFGLGVLFVTATLRRAWEHREDRFFLFLCVAALLVMGTRARMSGRMSSRYIIAFMPLLLLAAAPYMWRTLRMRAAALLAGAALGAFTLWRHFAAAE